MEHIQMVFEDGSAIPNALINMAYDGREFKTDDGIYMVTSVNASHEGEHSSCPITRFNVGIKKLQPRLRVKVIKGKPSDRDDYIIDQTVKLTKSGFSEKEVTAMVKMLVKAKFD